MLPRAPFPKRCIGLGFADAESLLAHARTENEAGERFSEFRLDYLASPEQGGAAQVPAAPQRGSKPSVGLAKSTEGGP